MDKERWKWIVTGLLILLALSVAFLVVGAQSGVDWGTVLGLVSPAGIVLLLLLGGLYQMGEALTCRTVVHTRLPQFTLWQAWRIVHLKIFFDVASFGTASIPMQTYALYRLGLHPGAGIGLMTLEYVLHKASVLGYGIFMLAAQFPWLRLSGSAALAYLLPACCVIAVIIAVLVLLCVWEPIQRGADWLICRLPEGGKWGRRKEAWRKQLAALYGESRAFCANKKAVATCFLWNIGKLFALFSIPWVCMDLLGITELTFSQGQLLSSLMLLITGALPNVAGIGPTEFSFLLLFSPYTEELTVAVLALYRLATYYAPFLVSIVPFCTINQGKSSHPQ